MNKPDLKIFEKYRPPLIFLMYTYAMLYGRRMHVGPASYFHPSPSFPQFCLFAAGRVIFHVSRKKRTFFCPFWGNEMSGKGRRDIFSALQVETREKNRILPSIQSRAAVVMPSNRRRLTHFDLPSSFSSFRVLKIDITCGKREGGCLPHPLQNAITVVLACFYFFGAASDCLLILISLWGIRAETDLSLRSPFLGDVWTCTAYPQFWEAENFCRARTTMGPPHRRRHNYPRLFSKKGDIAITAPKDILGTYKKRGGGLPQIRRKEEDHLLTPPFPPNTTSSTYNQLMAQGIHCHFHFRKPLTHSFLWWWSNFWREANDKPQKT